MESRTLLIETEDNDESNPIEIQAAGHGSDYHGPGYYIQENKSKLVILSILYYSDYIILKTQTQKKCSYLFKFQHL